MGRVVNRLDDDWSDNFAYDDPQHTPDWSWNVPDWAGNQLGATVREPAALKRSRRDRDTRTEAD
jgi:hypothetical protein